MSNAMFVGFVMAIFLGLNISQIRSDRVNNRNYAKQYFQTFYHGILTTRLTKTSVSRLLVK